MNSTRKSICRKRCWLFFLITLIHSTNITPFCSRNWSIAWLPGKNPKSFFFLSLLLKVAVLTSVNREGRTTTFTKGDVHRIGDLLLKITSKLEVLSEPIFRCERFELDVVFLFSYTIATLKNTVSSWKNWSNPSSGIRHLSRFIATLRHAKFATSL